MKNISFDHVQITGGFWKEKQDLVRDVTIRSVYHQFDITGRIDAFRCDWKPGMPKQPHHYWDSDVAKWIESVAYLTQMRREPELEALADAVIEELAAHQTEDGYFNIYYITQEPDKRFTKRHMHELYCAGHFMEAAVAYDEATGKDKLMHCVEKYADYIYKVFLEDHSAAFLTPGHEEIELALYRLYRHTGNEKYLEMHKFFIDQRGSNALDPKDESNQSNLPLREQKEATGHSVRAAYIYSGMADYALATGDETMRQACRTLFENIYHKKMYITGGIGANNNEAFSPAYDLPNAHAYSETCAGIGFAFFASRMQMLDPRSEYADVVERLIYNAVLSGLSLDGKCFFYVNPLEIPAACDKDPNAEYPITQRVEVFSCSCCPPNLTRFIPSIGNYVYSAEGDTIYVNQYMTSKAVFDGSTLEQVTDYPNNGRVTLTYHGVPKTLKFRVPAWCSEYTGTAENGYHTETVRDGDTVTVEFPMVPHVVSCDPRVKENVGKLAVTYGPTVFCMESVDNGARIRNISIRKRASFAFETDENLGCRLTTEDAYRTCGSSALYTHEIPVRATFIPYRYFANRGESEMAVWIREAE